jgi:hypothetical protein
MSVFPDALYALYDVRYVKRDGSNSITGDIIPDTDGARSLGSSIKKWYKGWLARVAIDSIESDLIPDGDNTRTLGSAIKRWTGRFGAIFASTLEVSSLSGQVETENIIPKATSTYSLGSAIRKWLHGYFDQITLGGIARSTWPDPGSGSQSMDDVYNNGSEVAVDNTDVVFKLSASKRFKITNADKTESYLDITGGGECIATSGKEAENVKELIWYSAYGDEVTTTKTQTLSNKTLTSPVVNGVVSGGVSSASGMILSDLMQTARETIELIDYTP